MLVVSSLATLGCGAHDDGPRRVAAEGEITFQGRPLERGAILFVPAGNTKGPRAGAIIEDGRYRVAQENGPVLGRLRVEIRSAPNYGYDATEPTESVKHIGEPLPRDDIPPQYNDRSKLVVETTAEGKNVFNFHLP